MGTTLRGGWKASMGGTGRRSRLWRWHGAQNQAWRLGRAYKKRHITMANEHHVQKCSYILLL